MTILSIAFGLLFPWVLGRHIIRSLSPRDFIPGTLLAGLSFAIGTGVLCQWMLLCGILGIPLSTGPVLLPLLAALLVLHFRNKNLAFGTSSSPRFLTEGQQKSRLPEIFLLLYLLSTCAFVCWHSFHIPVFTWDAISTVAFKAKMIYTDQSLTHLPRFPHAAYPLQVPFLEAWIAMNLGYWDDQWIKAIFPAAFACLLLSIYGFLRVFTSRRWSLLGCFFLSSANLPLYHAMISYRDFYVMFFNTLTIMLIILWHKHNHKALLFLAGMLAGFATFTKVEGSLYLGIYTVLVVGILWRSQEPLKEKGINFLRFSIPSYGMCASYIIYRLVRGIQLESKAGLELGWQLWGRLPTTLWRLFLDFFLSGNWNLIWLLLLVSVLRIQSFKNNALARFLGAALLLHFGVIVLLSTLTKSYQWLAGDVSDFGLSRIILHFFPLACLLIVALHGPRLREEGSQK